jgi:hypothetical protein
MENYTPQEVAQFIATSIKMASRPVLSVAIETLPTAGLITDQIKSIMAHETGYVQCAFAETPNKLNICLSMVSKEYIAQIDIPEKYAHDLYDKYNYLRAAAIGFWKHFMHEYPDLLRSMREARPDVNFDALRYEVANPMTLYFDENVAKRVGICPYYVNPEGKILIKNPHK